MFILLIAAFTAGASKPRTSKRAAKPRVINITAVVDSALIMADDYTTSLTQKPEFAQTRLNILKSYYKSLPTDAVRDSVSSRIFDYYVNYVEKGQKEQADGFKNCFLALVPDTNEHLGPLYANELILARESFDTIALENTINRLEAYANRMNYDYDDEISSARCFLHNLRSRKPVEDILPGVWVSEDIWKDRVMDYEYKDRSLKAILFHPVAIANSLAILKIPRAKNYNGELVAQKSKGITMNVYSGNGLLTIACKMAGIEGFKPVKQSELGYYNIGTHIGSEIFETITASSLDPHVFSKKIEIDNNAYAAYIFWGDEKLKRPVTEIASFVRQSTQHTQALIAGQLSRSQYSFGEKMIGNFFTNLASEAINSFIDQLMVSTDRIFSVETVLQVVNPFELKAKTYLQVVISKSNENIPHKFNFMFESTYYRWDSSDEIAFMGPYKVKDSEASALNLGGLLTLTELPKEQRKAKEKEIKEWCKGWKSTYKEELKALKKTADAMPKGPEKDLAKKRVKEFKKTRQQCWSDYNEKMYIKLKTKSDNYQP